MTLLLLRHADAKPRHGHATDHERPLTERGRADARAVGRFLTTIDHVPDQVLTSTATRARQTLAEVQTAGGWAHDEEATDKLYDARTEDVLTVVHDVPDSARTLLLVGHNPTFTEMVERLTGGGHVRMTPGTITRIDVESDRWSDLQWGDGQLRWLIEPKQLPRQD